MNASTYRRVQPSTQKGRRSPVPPEVPLSDRFRAILLQDSCATSAQPGGDYEASKLLRRDHNAAGA